MLNNRTEKTQGELIHPIDKYVKESHKSQFKRSQTIRILELFSQGLTAPEVWTRYTFETGSDIGIDRIRNIRKRFRAALEEMKGVTA